MVLPINFWILFGILSSGLSPGQESLTHSLKVLGLSSTKLMAHLPLRRMFWAVLEELRQESSIA